MIRWVRTAQIGPGKQADAMGTRVAFERGTVLSEGSQSMACGTRCPFDSPPLPAVD